MDDAILITELNDFIFCPVSIYFHKMYNGVDRMIFQSSDQINGTVAHEKVDNGTYSSRKNILKGMDVYSEKYNLRGKIDLLDISSQTLRERKKKSKQYMMVMADISNRYEKRFDQGDSVIIFILSKSCKTVRYGYAKNEEKDLVMIT